jgi:hypothetical protein
MHIASDLYPSLQSRYLGHFTKGSSKRHQSIQIQFGCHDNISLACFEFYRATHYWFERCRGIQANLAIDLTKAMLQKLREIVNPGEKTVDCRRRGVYLFAGLQCTSLNVIYRGYEVTRRQPVRYLQHVYYKDVSMKPFV